MLPQTLLHEFGFAEARITSLHIGISETFLVENPNGKKLIVKELREERGADQTPASEIAWLVQLAQHDVECLKPFFPHQPNENVFYLNEKTYSLYEFVAGSEPDRADLQHYKRAGKLLRQLHDAGEKILSESVDALLKSRPSYDLHALVTQFEPIIRSSSLFGEAIREVLLRNADKISAHFPDDRIFVHGDFHFGNLLYSTEDQTILDFDECGFGSRYYDLGTMRLHTMSEKNPEAWKVFLDGYGRDELDEKDLKYGAAARIYYLIGKVPKRFHVPDVAKDAVGIIERYTNIYLYHAMSDTWP